MPSSIADPLVQAKKDEALPALRALVRLLARQAAHEACAAADAIEADASTDTPASNLRQTDAIEPHSCGSDGPERSGESS